MASEFRLKKRVEFSETDMAGIVHYSNFFRYMEHAEHAFYRSLGFSVVDTSRQPPIGWPRVHAECDYKRPLRFEDEFTVHLVVEKRSEKSMTLGFRFLKEDQGQEIEVASGRLVVACVTRDASGVMRGVPIPEDLAAQLQPLLR